MTYQSSIGLVAWKQETFMQRIAAFVSALAVFAIPLFLSVTRLVGYKYVGREDSQAYVIYMASVFCISLLFYLLTFYKKPTIRKNESTFYIFIAWLFFDHTVRHLINPESTELISRALILFISLSLPSFFAARILNYYNAFDSFVRLVELITILIAIGLISIGVVPFLSGMGNSGIGNAYQNVAYYSATCFGLLCFYTFRAERRLTYSYTKQKFKTIINVSLMVLLFISTVLSGGRGGFILLLVYIFLMLYWLFFRKATSKAQILKVLVGLSIVSIILTLIYRQIMQNPWLSTGFQRAVSFINDGKIDLEGGSSGRDEIYDIAIRGISESPVWGYGPFGAWDRVIYPHNYFLDLSLQFGIPFAVLIIFSLLIYILKKIKYWNTQKVFLQVIMLVPLISLTFSGSYLVSPFLWFALASYGNLTTSSNQRVSSKRMY